MTIRGQAQATGDHDTPLDVQNAALLDKVFDVVIHKGRRLEDLLFVEVLRLQVMRLLRSVVPADATMSSVGLARWRKVAHEMQR
jgi:hypothetical protein